MVSLDDLKKICQEGESSTVEFKRELSGEVLQGLSTSLAAFANTEGGALLVGVDDDRQPVGFSPQPRHEDRNRVSTEAKNCSPPVPLDFEDLTFGKLSFLIIRVPGTGTLHCDKQKRFPIRVGSVIQYLDSAGVIAKLQALGGGSAGATSNLTWGAFLSGERTVPVEFDSETTRPKRPSALDVRLIKKVLASSDSAIQGEGLEQLRRLAWDHYGWYDRRLFPVLKTLLQGKDESRVLMVLQALRAGSDGGAGSGKKKAVTGFFRDQIAELCRSGPSVQVRMEALQWLKEVRDAEVVDILIDWAKRLDEETFRKIHLPHVLSNLSTYGYYDETRRQLLSEVTGGTKGRTGARLLEMLKALREHGR